MFISTDKKRKLVIRKIGLFVSMFFLVAMVYSDVWAQGYPNQPVKIIVPFAAGGPSDTVGRIVARHLSEALGQPFVIDNRPGAGGRLGMDLVAKSSPDGYTLVISVLGPTSLAPSIYSNLAYDSLRSFEHISRLTIQPTIMVVNSALDVKTVPDLISLAKSKPGKLTFCSTGIGTTPQLYVEMLKAQYGINLTHIPYKSGPTAVTDLISGRVDLMVDNIATLLPYVKSGQLRALAVTGNRKSSFLPTLPTAAESGLPDFENTIWFGLSAPAGIPKPVLQLLHAKVVEIVRKPDVKDAFKSLGAESSDTTPEEFRAFIVADIERWAKAAKIAGIKPQN